MKRWIYTCLGVCFFGVAAHAEFGNLDPNKMADVNGKTVNMPTLPMNSIPQSTVSQPTSPMTGQRVAPAQMIENKNVEMKTLEFSTVPSKGLPHGNVIVKPNAETKGLVDAKPPVETGVVSEKNADINKHVIPMTTPAGQQEIKDEFHK